MITLIKHYNQRLEIVYREFLKHQRGLSHDEFFEQRDTVYRLQLFILRLKKASRIESKDERLTEVKRLIEEFRDE